MRMIRKLTPGLLTLFFMLGMGVTAYAAGGTITIENSVAGQTYDAYRVFEYVPTDEANADDGGIYKLAPKFSGLPAYTYTDDGASVSMSSFFTVGDNDILNISGLETEQDRDLFGRAALTYAKANGIANDGSTTSTEDGVATISVSEYGWYVIDSSLGNKVAYATTTPNASIRERNGVPTVDLKVTDATNSSTVYRDKTGNDAQIGDTVSFSITSELKEGSKGYVIVDTVTSGLTLVPVQESDISFSDDSVDYTIDNEYVDEDGNKGFKVMFEGEPEGDTTVTVEYQAVVNKDAVIAFDENISEAFLIYGNGTETTHVTTKTITYPLQIKKIATGDPNEKILPGAEFKLIRKRDASAILFTKISDTEYRVDPEGTADCIVTVEEAPITVSGLNTEDYILVETQAPQGYTLLDSSVTVDGTEYSHACNVTVSDSSKTGAVQVRKIENGLVVKINGLYTYNGLSQAPELIVTTGTTSLTPGTDYETEYQKKKTDDNWERSSVINAGTYRVIVTGKGQYAGMNGSGEFAVKPKSVTITAVSITRKYNGSELTGGFIVTDLEPGDTHTFTVVMTDDSKITDAGEKDNVIASVDGTEVTTGTETAVGNYLVTTRDGILTVNPKPVTVKAKDKVFTYDGKAHSCPEYEVDGLVGDDKIEAEITGSITSPEEGEVVNKVSSVKFTKGNAGNYTVNTVDGKLTMTYGPVVTVTFDANNGSGKTDTQSAQKGSTVKLKKNEFAYAGHTFDSWNTKPDGKGKSYDDGESVGLEGDMILYAQWKQNPPEPVAKYTIKVKVEGEGEATASRTSAKAGKKITIKATPKAGWKFKKWKITKGVELKDATKASTSFIMPEKNVTVKAVFEKIYEAPQPDIEPVDDDKIIVAWWKVDEAKGYDIFMSRCNHGGKEITPKLVKTIEENETFQWTVTGLKPNKSYKAYIRAYVTGKNGKKKYISRSPLMHVYTAGGNRTYTNAKSVKINTSDGKIKKGKLTLNVKDTYKIRASVKKADKKKKLMPASHVKTLRYRSSDPGVASVSGKGKITARKKGKCNIYVYAHNGVNKTIKVTVE